MKWNPKVSMAENKHSDAKSIDRARNNPMRGLSVFTVFLILMILSAPEAVLALATDSQQPIEIEADFAELDDQEGRTIYVGNVIVTQGSIKMTGDKLKVLFDANKDLEHLHMEGRPAYFKQTPDGGKEDIEGEGLIIEYHAKESMLHLIQKAKLVQGDRIFTGDRINYDSEKSVITGRGQTKTAEDEKNPPKRGRVKVIIPPKKPTP